MRLSTYHAHTAWCDGKNTGEEMIEAALAAGMSDLGFSAHAAWPFSTEWHLPAKDYPSYVAEIRSLKERYRGSLRILCGFEADYLPGMTAPDHGLYARFAPDYLIGSIHYVGAADRSHAAVNREVAAEPWSVDGPAETVASTLERSFGGDGKRAVTEYWRLMKEMVTNCRFDIVGHADLPRKRNGELKFFDETAPWYRRELEETADAIARSGKVVEINTGAIPRKAMDDVYPSAEFLSLLARRDVPITVNSDAHSVQDLLAAYDRAYRAAREAGFAKLWFLNPEGWVSESLGE